MDSLINPLTFLTLGILIYSAILHEIAHGYIADRFGDPTARLMGRLTLNPLPHIDPIMTILLPLMLFISGSSVIFGGAKPVPIDPFNLKGGRKDIALVSLAGPLTNLILAIIGTLIFKLAFGHYSFLSIISRSFTVTNGVDVIAYIVAEVVSINVLLALFNLLPIPPLDGSKIFSLILPEKIANTFLSFGNMGPLLLLFLLLFPIPGFSLSDLIGNLYAFALIALGLLR